MDLAPARSTAGSRVGREHDPPQRARQGRRRPGRGGPKGAPAPEEIRRELPDRDALLLVVADVRSQGSVEAAVARGVEHYGTIDIVFASAGVLLTDTSPA